MNVNILITGKGLENFKREYQKLTHERPAAVLNLKKARELGDLSENAYYKASRAKLSFIDGRLFHLKYLLKHAQVINVSSSEVVDIGSMVSIKQDNKVKKYRLVSKYEADPGRGNISNVSPIGKALIGRRVGDSATFETPSGVSKFIIVNIET